MNELNKRFLIVISLSILIILFFFVIIKSSMAEDSGCLKDENDQVTCTGTIRIEDDDIYTGKNLELYRSNKEHFKGTLTGKISDITLGGGWLILRETDCFKVDELFVCKTKEGE